MLDEDVRVAPAVLPIARRLQVLGYCGALLLLLNMSAPYAGLIGIPVSFFLKNRLHLSAPDLAWFNLWVGIPLYVSFLFGFTRDRWSPFRAGDRGYLMLFGATSAATYVLIAFAPPGYTLLLGGLLVVTVSVQFVASAGNALVSATGQKHLMAGQASTVFNIATTLPALAAFFGGMLSDSLESEAAATAARVLFLLAAALMIAIVALAGAGPRWLFAESKAEGAERETTLAEIMRLLRHKPVYPALIILMLWDFGPALGTPLTYHMANALHASDTEVGAFYALFYGCMVPTLVLYGWMCQRLKLSRLLVIGTVFAVFQMLPLLVVHTPGAVLVAGVVMGLLGGFASGAYVDLAIRSTPPGLQGTMMMLVVTVYWIAVRFGDILGTDLYQHEGGFGTTVWATTAVYALIFPLLLLVPKSLTSTSDGEAAAVTNAASTP